MSKAQNPIRELIREVRGVMRSAKKDGLFACYVETGRKNYWADNATKMLAIPDGAECRALISKNRVLQIEQIWPGRC